jgi:hypothetical protein
MVEVRLRPGVPGCVTVPLAIMTLGLVPLLMRKGERHFIARMDEEGFETRGGTRIAWSEVERVQRTVGKVQGMKMSDELVLHTRKGRASLPTWRTVNADEALAYFQSHAPGETNP